MINKIIFIVCAFISIHAQGISFDPLNHMLENSKSFEYANLGLSQDEFDQLNQLNIETTTKFDQFGNSCELEDRLFNYMESVGSNDPEAIKIAIDTISRIARQLRAAAGKNSAWVSVRSYTAEASSDTPRWHIDGADYGLGNIALYPALTCKFTAALKGPSTYLYDLPVDQRDVFISKFNDRVFLSQFLDINHAESALPGHGVFFLVGDKEKGAIHSEPIFSESRLFFSVVVGDEDEIEDLYYRRIMQVKEDKSWEESPSLRPLRPEDAYYYWDKKCEEQYPILKDNIENYILHFNKAKDLVNQFEVQSKDQRLIDFYKKHHTHIAHGIDINQLYRELETPIPDHDQWGAGPVRQRFNQLEHLNMVLGWRIEEFQDLIKELKALL